MRTRARRRLRGGRGFTLAETLLAILILLMVAAIVAAGIPTARNVYERVVLASNAEVLLSTTVNTLRNELGTAKSVRIEGNSVIYLNDNIGAYSKISLAAAGDSEPIGSILLQRYADVDGLGYIPNSNNAGTDSLPVSRLISKEAATADLIVSYSAVSYANGVVTFEDLAVLHAGQTLTDSTPLTERKTLSIRVISR